jgi:hypothetical protein
MVALVQQRGISKYSEDKVRTIAELVESWGRVFSIPSIFVAAQILHETGFFSFTGDVKPNQNNYAGIGTTGGGVPGHSFKDENAGVLAVYVHHSVYLRGDSKFWDPGIAIYGNKTFNPRYDIVLEAVKRLGTVRTIGDYSSRWAVGPKYHETILKIMGMMKVKGQREEATTFKLRVSHIPWNNPNRTRLLSLPAGRGFITVHETGNPNKGANAEMHRKYTHNGGGANPAEGYEGVSFTYVLDSTGDVVELVPRGERTWQASDGAAGPGNSSVSIETCVNSDGDWTKTKEVLAQFIVYLLKADQNLSRTKIAQHNTWARDKKNCPSKLRANNGKEWNELMARIDVLLGEKVPDKSVTKDPNAMLVNGHWIINDILWRWESMQHQTLPMVGYPTSGMFEAPVSNFFRLVQVFERGILGVYLEGTPDGVPQDHPFRVRMLTPVEQAEVYEYGIESGFIK